MWFGHDVKFESVLLYNNTLQECYLCIASQTSQRALAARRVTRIRLSRMSAVCVDFHHSTDSIRAYPLIFEPPSGSVGDARARVPLHRGFDGLSATWLPSPEAGGFGYPRMAGLAGERTGCLRALIRKLQTFALRPSWAGRGRAGFES